MTTDSITCRHRARYLQDGRLGFPGKAFMLNTLNDF